MERKTKRAGMFGKTTKWLGPMADESYERHVLGVWVEVYPAVGSLGEAHWCSRNVSTYGETGTERLTADNAEDAMKAVDRMVCAILRTHMYLVDPAEKERG